jgi:hypothetical protein
MGKGIKKIPVNSVDGFHNFGRDHVGFFSSSNRRTIGHFPDHYSTTNQRQLHSVQLKVTRICRSCRK